MTREFDNWLWMKKLSKEQILYELRRMRNRPRFKTEPWLHQLVCFYIGLHQPEFLFLLDMGLGKSKIIIDLIVQAERERRLNHALVLVPRLINIDSWQDDVARHSDLGMWGCNVKNIEEKWERLANPPADHKLTVIDLQGLHWALSKKKSVGKKSVLVPDEARVRQVRKLYNFINIDESHKLTNHESLWYMLVRRLCKTSDFTYATTGTLFGREVQDIWPQFYLVDGGETFGENMGCFRAGFFDAEPNKWGRGDKYTYRKSMDAKLNEMLQHRSLRYDENEVHDLPKRVSVVKQISMSEEQRQHYLRALEGLINAGGNLEELEGQYVKLRQIVSGYLSWKDEHGPHLLRFKENPKLEDLESIIEDAGARSKLVICYHYTETGRMISDRLKELKIDHEWFYGGTKDKSASRARFMNDRGCRIFLMNDEAGGTGNDGLQKVSRYLILYETPTSPITRQQVIKRIHRPGQNMRSFIYDLVMRKSLDPGILQDIKENRDTYDSVVNGKRRPGKGFFLQDWDPVANPP